MSADAKFHPSNEEFGFEAVEKAMRSEGLLAHDENIELVDTGGVTPVVDKIAPDGSRKREQVSVEVPKARIDFRAGLKGAMVNALYAFIAQLILQALWHVSTLIVRKAKAKWDDRKAAKVAEVVDAAVKTAEEMGDREGASSDDEETRPVLPEQQPETDTVAPAAEKKRFGRKAS